MATDKSLELGSSSRGTRSGAKNQQKNAGDRKRSEERNKRNEGAKAPPKAQN